MRRLIAPTILLALAVPLVAMTGCNMVKLTANTTADVLEVAAPGLQQESDPQLAREAAPGQLKTVEGFYLASPGNRKIIKILAQGYCEYAFGFLQDDIETLEMANKPDEAAPIAKRATGLFLRCMNYGLKLLGSSWDEALRGDLATWEKKVNGAGSDEVTGLFFVGLGLASAINLNRDNIDMVAYLPKARLIFERVLKLNEKYYNGGAHMAMGMLLTSQGDAIGGNSVEGKKHFERAIEITGGKYLMPKVLFALNYGVVTGNQKFFHDTLVEVLNTSPAVWPEQRLANELAHIRARRYLSHEKEWF
jgi:hypothetical protein